VRNIREGLKIALILKCPSALDLAGLKLLFFEKKLSAMKISKIDSTGVILGTIISRGRAIFFLILWSVAGAFPAGAQAPSTFLHVDQFGYLPEAAKIAVIADPQVGFNANAAYIPGASF